MLITFLWSVNMFLWFHSHISIDKTTNIFLFQSPYNTVLYSRDLLLKEHLWFLVTFFESVFTSIIVILNSCINNRCFVNKARRNTVAIQDIQSFFRRQLQALLVDGAGSLIILELCFWMTLKAHSQVWDNFWKLKAL